MRIVSSDLQAIELKAVLISFLGHLLFIKFFLLAFIARPSEFKPNFIFVGAILSENDFRNLAETKKPSSAKQILPTIKIKNDSDVFSRQQILTKPVVSPVDFQKQKTFLKSSFIKTSEELPAKNNAQDFGIELSIPKRVPLKLDLK